MNKISKEYQHIEIGKLTKAEWNYKEDDALTESKLIENLRKNGQVENIIVRETDKGMYEVVNGNHRLKAYQTLGYKKVLCYNLGKVNLLQAKQIAIETNETRFAPDRIKLAERVTELAEEFGSADIAATMPFSEKDISNLQSVLTYDWNDKAKRIKCPNCHKEFKKN